MPQRFVLQNRKLDIGKHSARGAPSQIPFLPEALVLQERRLSKNIIDVVDEAMTDRAIAMLDIAEIVTCHTTRQKPDPATVQCNHVTGILIRVALLCW